MSLRHLCVINGGLTVDRMMETCSLLVGLVRMHGSGFISSKHVLYSMNLHML